MVVFLKSGLIQVVVVAVLSTVQLQSACHVEGEVGFRGGREIEGHHSLSSSPFTLHSSECHFPPPPAVVSCFKTNIFFLCMLLHYGLHTQLPAFEGSGAR